MSKKATPGLYLGFDYGTRSLGVAVGQLLTREARPLCNLPARDGTPNWDSIGKLLAEWQPEALVVGMPLNMDGTASDMSQRAQKFANRLHGRFGLPVHTHDERLTTFAAKGERMQRGEYSRNFRDDPVDALAASLLLQGWLENQP